MSTSVKIDAEDKTRLEKLQALVTLKIGAKVTQQELLATLIREAVERGDEFVDRVWKVGIPLQDEEYAKLLALVEDWGVATSWRDVDRILYGTGRRRRR